MHFPLFSYLLVGVTIFKKFKVGTVYVFLNHYFEIQQFELALFHVDKYLKRVSAAWNARSYCCQ